MEIKGNIVLIEEKQIRPGAIIIEDGIIKEIVFDDGKYDNYILPGFIDSHVHIESSMMVPENFGNAVMSRGTVAVVTDPHEIANVLGEKGINFMLENAEKTNLKIFFGVPSCVPATEFETSGAILNAEDIDRLFQTGNFVVLSEMMNFPGVVFDDPAVHEKLKIAKKHNLPVDGHAPGLSGSDLKKYVSSGISTDHECSTLEEAEEKIRLGMKILIREGSAARNFEALYHLIDKYPDEVMLCTDDSHPDELLENGHIDKIVRSGVEKGLNTFNLLKAACINPVLHYNLPVGLLRRGDPADFIVVDDLKQFRLIATYINGEKQSVKPEKSGGQIKLNNFAAQPIDESKIKIKITNHEKEINVNIIQAFDGELLTKKIIDTLTVRNGFIEADPTRDILKLVVLNRYVRNAIPSVAFIKGFGIKNGAIAGTIAHDSHNIIAVGTNDRFITEAINKLIETGGGILALNNEKTTVLPLPVAGLLSDAPFSEIAQNYKALNEFIHKMGSPMRAPFMTLAFMALLVIPEIKLSDKGLFDGKSFKFINLIANN